jgi:hypothetical protein
MRAIPDHTGYYATDDGRILSVRRKGIRELKGYINSDGYLTVTVTGDDGIKRKTLVHRLITLAYHGEPPFDDAVVRHLNGKKLDNRPSNLAWGTQHDNYMDAVRHGTRATGEGIGAKITPPDVVRKVRAAFNSGLTGKAIAEMFGLSTAQVSRIKNGKRWSEVI